MASEDRQSGIVGRKVWIMSDTPEAIQAVMDAAWHVVENAYGTTPRHTRGRNGGCRDDCIPCGVEKLWAALARTEAGRRHFLNGPVPAASPQ